MLRHLLPQSLRRVRSFRRHLRAFTLVELMIVVAIIGVLAALAIYGMRNYLAAARSAEAKQNVGNISRLATLSYERERHDAELLPDGTISKPATHVLCDTAQPVPLAGVPAGKKYQPITALGSDFNSGSVLKGWQCLGFSINTPIYYRYTYQSGSGFISPALGGPDPGGEGFEAAAQGDGDGDGQLATFARVGAVNNKQIRVSTEVFIHQESE